MTFEEDEDIFITRPRGYSRIDNFARTSEIVKDQLNGEYVSANREPHFKIPKTVNAKTKPEPTMPEFDPEELMVREWKGKKIGEKEYAKGSLNWGWDFKRELPDSVISVLKKGSRTIGEYEFALT